MEVQSSLQKYQVWFLLEHINKIETNRTVIELTSFPIENISAKEIKGFNIGDKQLLMMKSLGQSEEFVTKILSVKSLLKDEVFDFFESNYQDNSLLVSLSLYFLVNATPAELLVHTQFIIECFLVAHILKSRLPLKYWKEIMSNYAELVYKIYQHWLIEN